MTRTCVIVSGMHRSGTSMAAGILEKLGCDAAANPMAANFANEKGYFESLPIAQFNDRLLASCGSDWKDIQRVPPGWFSSPHAVSARAEAIELLEAEYGTSALFVLKDPRMCRLMPFWLEVFRALNIIPLILHVHRSPLAVADSLAKRDGLPWDYCLLLWLRHVLEAEQATRGVKRHFTSYENLLANWGRETARASETFGLEWPRLTNSVTSEVSNFTARDLRHHHYRPEDVAERAGISGWIQDTFAVCENWATTGEDPAGREVLDAIHDSYDQSMPAFAGIAKAMIDEHSSSSRLSAELEKLAERHAASERDATYWRETSEELHKKIEKAGAEAERQDRDRQKELADLQNALSEKEAAMSTAAQEAAAEKDRINQAYRDEMASMAAAHKEQTAAISTRHKEKNAERISRLEKKLYGVRSSKQKIQRELAAVSDHRDRLLASSSWRITAPLRRLTELVRPR